VPQTLVKFVLHDPKFHEEKPRVVLGNDASGGTSIAVYGGTEMIRYIAYPSVQTADCSLWEAFRGWWMCGTWEERITAKPEVTNRLPILHLCPVDDSAHLNTMSGRFVL
jgi:hypothetical protein